MDKHKLEPCMVSTSTTSISIAVPSNYTSIHDVLSELDDFADVTYRVCAVGDGFPWLLYLADLLLCIIWVHR